MKVKYNRVSTLGQTGNRFNLDTEKYDEVIIEKISGTVAFKDRPKAKKLIQSILSGKVTEVVVEEFSRLGRNTADVINNLDWLEEMQVNVNIRNLGLQSRPNGEKNPIFKLLSNILSSVYEMELENIKERTTAGRIAYVNNGGVLGRPIGTEENGNKFLQKEKSIKIIKALKKNLTIREVADMTATSTKTVQKVKSLAKEHNLL